MRSSKYGLLSTKDVADVAVGCNVCIPRKLSTLDAEPGVIYDRLNLILIYRTIKILKFDVSYYTWSLGWFILGDSDGDVTLFWGESLAFEFELRWSTVVSFLLKFKFYVYDLI